LDLEGAPFLESEAAPASPAQAAKATQSATQEKALPAGSQTSRKTLFLIPAVLLLLILAGGAAAYYLLFMDEERKLGLKTPPGVEVVVIPSTPPALPPAPGTTHKIDWAPFWVELQDPEGEIRFVYCQFALLTDNRRVAMQVRAKDLTLRDAVYYFLRHKPYGELADSRRLEALKSEILGIINYYILPEQAQGMDGTPIPTESPQYERVQDILLVDYLIK